MTVNNRQSRPKTKHLPKGLIILHEDKDLIIVDKPYGLLTMGEEHGRDTTVFHALSNYVRKGSAASKKQVYTVHRLDRDTSGVLIFAKSAQAKFTIKDTWKETKKKYLAVVHGKCEKTADTLESYLIESEKYDVYKTLDTRKGRLCRTAYRVLKTTKDYSLLEIDLLTGFKHQIRVQLAGIGHPVVGDKRYGKDKREYKRMALHALSITFKHPFSGKEVTFRTEVPPFFSSLMRRTEEADTPSEKKERAGSSPRGMRKPKSKE